jgi:hypothetical protein
MTVDICVNCGDDEGHYPLCLDCLSATETPHSDGVLMVALTTQDFVDFLAAAEEHGQSLREWAVEALRERVYR